MSMQDSLISRKREQGIALLIALLILVIISILGISAMRTSLFNAKIATGAQVGTMAFQGAESAIAAVYDEAGVQTQNPNNIVNEAIAYWSASNISKVIYRCVTASQVDQSGQCASSDYMDSRKLVKASSRTIISGVMQDYYTQMSTSGATNNQYGYYSFMTVAKGSVPGFNVSNYNVQEFVKFGPLGGGSTLHRFN